MSSEAIILTDPGAIDLTRHGVIEAHAGTGKTYTIVQLVLRVLEERDPRAAAAAADGSAPYIHIRSILLVTFTEKAAGELRRRIREGLARRIAELGDSGADAELRAHLESSLNNLHEALIGTIHAVCLRLLRTWPFETGVHFDTEIVDDDEGLESALRESMRTDWQDDATLIPWALRALEARGERLDEGHFALMREAARELLDEGNAVLDREAVGGAGLADLQALADGDQRVVFSLSDGADFIAELRGGLAIMRSIVDDPQGLFSDAIIAELERRLAVWEAQLRDGIDPLTFANLKSYDGGKRINTAKTRQHPSFDALARFHDRIAVHPLLALLRGDTLAATLVCDAAALLARRWNRAKRERGLVSYADMLRLMHDALRRGGDIVDALRARLRFGIIDEFQDTSVLQWRIFEGLFLERADAAGPRLFIVGDPKQSIYSFQGADVESYLAARRAIVERGGTIYYLDRNFRSCPATIEGYNAILSGDGEGGDWFAFGDGGGITYPSDDGAGRLVAPPDRTARPEHGLAMPAVQVMVLEGTAGHRRRAMARQIGDAIESLRGSDLSIPRGMAWESIRLEYGHFAVVAEGHRPAAVVLDELRARGIPAVKYKMEGVFQSAMARDLQALLRAILHREGDPAPRLAALLTHFFNRAPEDIDPERDLEPCAAGPGCRGDDLCLAHALERWTMLADTRQWALLFRDIRERTGIAPRLMALRDGERHLADLRQVIEYGIELLYRGNRGLAGLAEELGMLLREETRTGVDRNLHVLATDRSSVKVLTMHAAKGLEFPVVFAVTGGSRQIETGAAVVTWIDGERRRRVRPQLSRKNDERVVEQMRQERRRLLYVALTRPQAYLFVPMQFKTISRRPDGTPDLDGSELGADNHYPDRDLTPRLQRLARTGGLGPQIALMDDRGADASAVRRGEGPHASAAPALADIPDIALGPLVTLQTSYSQLSRNVAADRDDDRSEEDDRRAAPTAGAGAAATPLPGGRKTGDALHRVLEELLLAPDPGRTAADRGRLSALVERQCARDVLAPIADADARARALAYAVDCVAGALATQLALPGGGAVTIGSLERGCRRPELEFLLRAEGHWVLGYLDLLFRVPARGEHPWRYFVLDWKSDTLESYDDAALARCMDDRHYDLQARLYCHALDRHLAGLLGAAYDPAVNLGGALYLFLRGGAAGAPAALWTRQAQPDEDARFVTRLMEQATGRVHL